MIPFIALLRASAFTVGQKFRYVRHGWQLSDPRGDFSLVPNSCHDTVCPTLYRAHTFDSKHQVHSRYLLLCLIIFLLAKPLYTHCAPNSIGVAHAMSYQASNETCSKSPDTLANTQKAQSIWPSETSSRTSSPGEEIDKLMATTAHSFPTLCKRHTRHISEGHCLSAAPVHGPYREDATSWAGTTLDGHSQSGSGSTLYEDEPTLDRDTCPQPSPRILDSLDPAAIPLPADLSEPESLEEPEPTVFDGTGLVLSTSRHDALALDARWIGKCAKRRLEMKVFAKARRYQKYAEEDKGKDGGRDRVDSVVGDQEWRTEEEEKEVQFFGIVRPVEIRK
jgi:hypothetical protein